MDKIKINLNNEPLPLLEIENIRNRVDTLMDRANDKAKFFRIFFFVIFSVIIGLSILAKTLYGFDSNSSIEISCVFALGGIFLSLIPKSQVKVGDRVLTKMFGRMMIIFGFYGALLVLNANPFLELALALIGGFCTLYAVEDAKFDVDYIADLKDDIMEAGPEHESRLLNLLGNKTIKDYINKLDRKVTAAEFNEMLRFHKEQVETDNRKLIENTVYPNLRKD